MGVHTHLGPLEKKIQVDDDRMQSVSRAGGDRGRAGGSPGPCRWRAGRVGGVRAMLVACGPCRWRAGRAGGMRAAMNVRERILAPSGAKVRELSETFASEDSLSRVKC